MCSDQKCADYFKSQGSWHRCMEEFRKKWRSYGKAAGRITLAQTTPEERRVIGGILGKTFYEETIRFSFAEFEQGLQKTRFAPVDMKAVLELYFGETLCTNQGRKREIQQKKDRFFAGICAYFEEKAGQNCRAALWLRGMIADKKYGYQLLIREYGRDEKEAELLAKNTGNAALKLKELSSFGEGCPLAVFSADISGNPHYFDRQTTAGMLLMHAVCFSEGTEMPKNAHQWRELLMRVSVIPDNVSSMVHAYDLRLRTKYGYHPAYDAFCTLKEPFVVTMENIKRITGIQAVGNRVYVVENEMVFSYLTGNLESDCTLLCTSGQPRFAAEVLFSHMIAAGTDIYYNGDMDPAGLCIADRLWKKYGARFRIWRMSPEDYEISLSKEQVGTAELIKLANIGHPVLRQTAESLKKKQTAGYQENMLNELLTDIREFQRAGGSKTKNM